MQSMNVAPAAGKGQGTGYNFRAKSRPALFPVAIVAAGALRGRDGLRQGGPWVFGALAPDLGRSADPDVVDGHDDREEKGAEEKSDQVHEQEPPSGTEM